jgi:subtilisin family serine protease
MNSSLARLLWPFLCLSALLAAPSSALADVIPASLNSVSPMRGVPRLPAVQPSGRRVIGAAERVSLNTLASTQAGLAKQLKHLYTQAAGQGSIRLIVGVRAPFAAEGVLTATEAAGQRSDIRAVQTAVLDTIPTLGAKAHRFEFIPFMALVADVAELDSLTRHPDVTSIDEDHLVEATLAQSSPLIGATTANGAYRGNGQTVVVLDTGVDKAHPFLSGKVVAEACYSTTYSAHGATSVCPGGASESTVAGSGVNCGVSGCEHGTHVAGIMAGSGGSFSGVAPGASVIAMQVFSRFDSTTNCGGASTCVLSYTSDQIKALQRVYALRSSYSIAAVNMSLGGGRYTSQVDCDTANGAIKAAIDNLRAANIATVISSGNNGYADAMGAPGCVSSAISVGSTWDAAMSSSLYFSGAQCSDSGGVDQVACYSNSASFLNLLAPGSQINSAIPGGSYANFHGTSMAAPQVAGTFALLKQKVPALTVAEALSALTATGTLVTDTRNGIAKPRIRVNDALAYLAGSSPPTYTLTVSRAGSGSGTVSGSGINCGATCSQAYAAGTAVSLTATPDSGSVFAGWSGDCTSTSCTVTMNAARSVVANFELSGTARPDLVVTAGSASASGMSEGEISVAFTVGNQGSVSSAASWLGILVSRDTQLGSVDIDSGWGCNIDALAPGQSQDCAGPITLPKLDAGSYYLGGYADYGDAIAESDESNNGLASSSATAVWVDFFPYGGQVPAGWQLTAGSNAMWQADATTHFGGSHSLRSGTIVDSQTSGIRYAANFPAGTISFAIKVSSEDSYDYLRFYIDDVEYGAWSGEQDWLTVTFSVGAGFHELKWIYSKDSSLSLGADAAWVDVLVLPPGMTPGAPTIDRVVPGSTSVRISFTAPASAGASAITGYTASCTGDGVTLSATGTASPIVVTGLSRGVAYSCTVSAINGAGAGTPSASTMIVATSAGRMVPILQMLLLGEVAARAAVCGNTAPTVSMPTAACDIGTVSSGITATADAYRWTCAGLNGGASAACVAPRQYVVNAVAGTNGTVSPSTRLVTYGTTATFTVTPYPGYAALAGGTCSSGSLAGSTYTTGSITGSCQVDITFANSPPPVNGVCAATSPTLTPPTPTCSVGTVESGSFVEGVDAWTWNCLGLYGGTPAACMAPRLYTVSAAAGSNGTISPSGPTARTVTYGSTTTFTVTPNSGYAATVNVTGSCGTGSLAGTTYTTGPVTGGTCAVSATFTPIPISSCGPTPANYVVLNPGSSFGGDYWNPYNPAEVFLITLAPQQGVALGFSMADLRSVYPYGFLTQNAAGGTFSFNISECPGSSVPLLNQDGTIDINGDGRNDRCNTLGMYGRYNDNSSGSNAFYNNAANLAIQSTCFLPTTSGGSPGYYYLNIFNVSTTTARPLQYRNAYQAN